MCFAGKLIDEKPFFGRSDTVAVDGFKSAVSSLPIKTGCCCEFLRSGDRFDDVPIDCLRLNESVSRKRLRFGGVRYESKFETGGDGGGGRLIFFRLSVRFLFFLCTAGG